MSYPARAEGLVISTNPCANLLMTVPSAPITIGITVTLVLYIFCTYLFFRFLSVLHCCQPKQGSPLFGSFSFLFFFLFFFFLLLLIISRSGHLVEIRWSVCILESQRILCISFSRVEYELCISHLFVWSNFNFLHSSQWITFPSQSCLVLYSFWTNLLHSIIWWLIISSLSPDNLHLLFSWVLIFLLWHHHHHHVMPLVRISLTLSRHYSLSFISSDRSSGLHPVSSHSCCMYVRAGHPAFTRSSCFCSAICGGQ